MSWREYEKRPTVRRINPRSHKAKKRPIFGLERLLKVSGEVSPEFLERMGRLGMRVKKVDR